MCNATVGASPVCVCTCAASETFSNGSRGTPGWVNTLKPVPELPNAQEGSSIACSASRGAMSAKEVMSFPCGSVVVSVEVEYLAQFDEALIGAAVESREE